MASKEQGTPSPVTGAVIGSVWRKGKHTMLQEDLPKVLVDPWNFRKVNNWGELASACRRAGKLSLLGRRGRWPQIGHPGHSKGGSLRQNVSLSPPWSTELRPAAWSPHREGTDRQLESMTRAAEVSDDAAETVEEQDGQIAPDTTPTGNCPHLWRGILAHVNPWVWSP